MIRDPESFNLLLDTISRFARDQGIPHESGNGVEEEVEGFRVADHGALIFAGYLIGKNLW